MPPETIRISGFHGGETLRIERASDGGLVLTLHNDKPKQVSVMLTARDAVVLGEFLAPR